MWDVEFAARSVTRAVTMLKITYKTSGEVRSLVVPRKTRHEVVSHEHKIATFEITCAMNKNAQWHRTPVNGLNGESE